MSTHAHKRARARVRNTIRPVTFARRPADRYWCSPVRPPLAAVSSSNATRVHTRLHVAYMLRVSALNAVDASRTRYCRYVRLIGASSTLHGDSRTARSDTFAQLPEAGNLVPARATVARTLWGDEIQATDSHCYRSDNRIVRLGQQPNLTSPNLTSYWAVNAKKKKSYCYLLGRAG